MTKFSDVIEKLREPARRHGASLPEEGVSPGDLSSSELLDVRQALVQTARGLLREIEEAKGDAELRAAERTHDLAMSAFDEIVAEFDRRSIDDAEERARANRPTPADGQAPLVDDGCSFGEARGGWVDSKGAAVRVLSRRESFARAEYRGPGIGAVLRAMVHGPRNEAEERALGTTSGSAGGFTVPAPLAGHFIDRMRARSVVMAAGARTVPMETKTLQIARLETDPTVSWRLEGSSIGLSDPTFGRVLLEAKNLASMVVVNRELLADTVNAGAILENAFVKAFALEFDRACLFGTGSSDAQPLGLGNVAGINVVSGSSNGSVFDPDKLLDAIYEMQLDNAEDPTALIWHPRTLLAMNKLREENVGLYQLPEQLARLPKLRTTSVPINQVVGTSSDASTVLLGDFREMLVGLREEVRIGVLNERYADYGQVGFVVHMRGDVQFAHLESFAKYTGIVPAST